MSQLTVKKQVQFLSMADTMQKTIDNKSASRLENTHRRARMAAGARKEAERLTLIQSGLLALGNMPLPMIPELLLGLTSKDLIHYLLSDLWQYPHSGVRAALIEAGIPEDKFQEAAEALRSLIRSAGLEKKVDPVQEKIADITRRVRLSRKPGFFPTPDNIIDLMFERGNEYWPTVLDAETGIYDRDDAFIRQARVLEPSAGDGAIADRLRKRGITPDVIEWDYELRELLALKGYNVVSDNLIGYWVTGDACYDAIYMNPPFEDRADAIHIQAAFKLLRPGGHLIAIASAAAKFRTDKEYQRLRQLVDWYGCMEDLPEGSFKSSGTNVNTVLIRLKKGIEDG